MNVTKLGGALVLALLLFIQPIMSAETGVMKTVKAGKWGVMIHLNAIPKEHREMAKATHHVAFFVTDEKGNEIPDGKVTFQFLQKTKVAASGEAKYMGGMQMEGHATHGGHYGSDLTLTDGGAYTLKITVVVKGVTQKAGVDIIAPK